MPKFFICLYNNIFVIIIVNLLLSLWTVLVFGSWIWRSFAHISVA